MDPPPLLLLLLLLALPRRHPLFPGPPPRKPGERVTGKGRSGGTSGTRSQMRVGGHEKLSRDICERHSMKCQNNDTLLQLGLFSFSALFVFVLFDPFLLVVLSSPGEALHRTRRKRVRTNRIY